MSVSFDDLVTVATVGVARKGLPDGTLAGQAGQADVPALTGSAAADPAAALLDAVALLTAARRAGMQPLSADRPAPGSASDASGPDRELSARAARLLRRLGHADASGVFPVPYSNLLAGPLAAARDAGYVLPAPLLPSLLDLAARDPELRPVVTALLGARGRWLAGHRPDWRRVVGQAQAAGAGGPDSVRPAAVTDGEKRTWRTGSRDERRGALAALRRRDPAAGRELLTTGWGKETGADRAALLDMLRHGLSAADEEFLEAALDDRASGVRDTARDLLARLPDSAFSRRAAERAAPLLRVERHGLRRRLAVTLPAEPDAAAARDGVPAVSAVDGLGNGGWRLIHVLAAAPLGDWERRLGLAPADLAGLPAADDLRAHVHAGWRRAVARQRGTGALTDEEQAAWALALLSADVGRDVKWRARAWTYDAALAAALPAGIRAERTAGLLNRAGFGDLEEARALEEEVVACPVPWLPVLADAVLVVLTRAAGKPNLPELARALLELADRGLPAPGRDYAAEPPRDYAAMLTKLAAQEQPWSPRLEAAAETIALRSAFQAELGLSS